MFGVGDAGGLEVVEGRGEVAVVVPRPARVVVERTRPALGAGVRRAGDGPQGQFRPLVRAVPIGDREHVRGIDGQEVVADAFGEDEGLPELLGGRRRVAGRVQHSAPLEREPDADDRRQRRTGRCDFVEQGGSVVKPALQAERSGQLGGQFGGDARPGDSVARQLPEALLACHRVVEIPEAVKQLRIQCWVDRRLRMVRHVVGSKRHVTKSAVMAMESSP